MLLSFYQIYLLFSSIVKLANIYFLCLREIFVNEGRGHQLNTVVTIGVNVGKTSALVLVHFGSQLFEWDWNESFFDVSKLNELRFRVEFEGKFFVKIVSFSLR